MAGLRAFFAVTIAVLTQLFTGAAKPQTIPEALNRIPMAQTEEAGRYEFTWLGLRTNYFYYPESGKLIGKNDGGVGGVQYFNFDTKQYLIYGAQNSWFQPGYNEMMDKAAWIIAFKLESARFTFTYGGKDRMIQFWKGRYTPFLNGGEIGLYEKPLNQKAEHYKRTDDRLVMGAEFWRGGKKIITFEPARMWWLYAGQLDNPFTHIVPPNKLTMNGHIQFEDEGMLKAFLESIPKTAPPTFSYTTRGLEFRFEWKNSA
ncbi:MAG: DUF4474 domain-containing protein [Oscillospiraceae bacterium]|jgi:hypothetical protein|nr:DUF4474 domain-containing protein [Oscillospiraceae bacterium]